MTSSEEKILSRFKDSSILVIGDFMIDEYVMGIVERISPEAPVPVVHEVETKFVPGGAGNVVCNLRALGSRVLLAGITGADETAKRLKGSLLELGVSDEDLFLLESQDRPTTIKTRIMAGNQQVCRLDREKRLSITPRMETDLLRFIAESMVRIQGIIFSDYDKGVVTPELIRQTVELARKNGVFIAVDPQVTHFHYYKNVDVLTPNHHEAGRFLGRDLKTDEAVEEAAGEIVRKLDAKMALITRGEKGMSIVESSDMKCRHYPTRAREVFDVTGAGDTVISIFTLSMICGATSEEAVHLSNAGAGIVVGKIGAATVSVEDLQKQF